jgi:hypothetical protein
MWKPISDYQFAYKSTIEITILQLHFGPWRFGDSFDVMLGQVSEHLDWLMLVSVLQFKLKDVVQLIISVYLGTTIYVMLDLTQIKNGFT